MINYRCKKCSHLQYKYGISVKHQVVWIQIKCYSCNQLDNLIIKLDKDDYKLINKKDVDFK